MKLRNSSSLLQVILFLLITYSKINAEVLLQAKETVSLQNPSLDFKCIFIQNSGFLSYIDDQKLTVVRLFSSSTSHIKTVISTNGTPLDVLSLQDGALSVLVVSIVDSQFKIIFYSSITGSDDTFPYKIFYHSQSIIQMVKTIEEDKIIGLSENFYEITLWMANEIDGTNSPNFSFDYPEKIQKIKQINSLNRIILLREDKKICIFDYTDPSNMDSCTSVLNSDEIVGTSSNNDVFLFGIPSENKIFQLNFMNITEFTGVTVDDLRSVTPFDLAVPAKGITNIINHLNMTIVSLSNKTIGVYQEIDDSTPFKRFEMAFSNEVNEICSSINGLFIVVQDATNTLNILQFGGCDDNCTTCSGPTEYQCESCQNPPDLRQISTRCAPSCFEGSYQSNTTNCAACDNLCKTCDGPGSTDCLSCDIGRFFKESTSTCELTCEDGFYQDESTRKCSECSLDCQICSQTDKNYCTSCEDGKYNDGNGNCVQCMVSCNTCSDGISCIDCQPFPYFHETETRKCLTECQTNSIKSGNTCQLCDPSCSSCQNQTTKCLSCSSPSDYLYSNGTCSSSCPAITHYIDNLLCLECSELTCPQPVLPILMIQPRIELPVSGRFLSIKLQFYTQIIQPDYIPINFLDHYPESFFTVIFNPSPLEIKNMKFGSKNDDILIQIEFESNIPVGKYSTEIKQNFKENDDNFLTSNDQNYEIKIAPIDNFEVYNSITQEEIEKADRIGQNFGTLTSNSESPLDFIAFLGGLLGLDSSASLIQFRQQTVLLNRMTLINYSFGKLGDSFFEAQTAKYSKINFQNWDYEKDRQQNRFLAAKDDNNLSEFNTYGKLTHQGVPYFIGVAGHIQMIMLIVIFILEGIFSLYVQYKSEITELNCYVLVYIRKFKLTIFLINFQGIAFFGPITLLRINIFHLKTITALASYILTLISSVIIIFEFIQIIKAANLPLRNKKICGAKNKEESSNSHRNHIKLTLPPIKQNNKKNKILQQKSINRQVIVRKRMSIFTKRQLPLDLKLNSPRIMRLKKKKIKMKEQKEQQKQIITQESKIPQAKDNEIDQNKTRRLHRFNLEYYAFVRGDFVFFKSVNSNLPSFTGHIHIFYLLRVAVYQMTVTSLQPLPFINLIVLIALEIIFIPMNLTNILLYRRYSSRCDIILERILQSCCCLLFLLLVLMINIINKIGLQKYSKIVQILLVAVFLMAYFFQFVMVIIKLVILGYKVFNMILRVNGKKQRLRKVNFYQRIYFLKESTEQIVFMDSSLKNRSPFRSKVASGRTKPFSSY